MVSHLAGLTSISMGYLCSSVLFSQDFLLICRQFLSSSPGGHMSDQHCIWEVVLDMYPRVCR